MKITLTLIFLLSIATAYSQDFTEQSRIHNDFSFMVYRASLKDTSNLFISPYSIRLALLATAEGSKGETKSQYDKLIGSYGGAKSFIKEMNSDKLDVANSLWANQEIKIKDEFIKASQTKFNSEIFTFNPNNTKEASTRVNKWVSQKTHDRIKEMDGPTSNTVLIVLNAVYFKDKWSIPFNEKATKLQKFHAINGKTQNLPTMYSNEEYLYYEDGNLQALTLSYDSDFDIIVLLPIDRKGLKKIEAKADASVIKKIVANSARHETKVYLPKFKFTSELYLISALKERGFAPMFSPSANYTGITDEVQIVPSEVIHKTFIEVNEKTTEAAAVTEVSMVGWGGAPQERPEPKIFKADHPFMFLIVKRSTQGIVFAGRFAKGVNK